MKFSTNTAYILSASLFAAGMVGTLAWTKGGKLYGSVFLIASIAIAYYAYRRSHKDVNITAYDVNLKLAGMVALLIPDKGHINNIINQ